MSAAPESPGYPAHEYERSDRVWDEGRDVTDDPPETWPWPWSAYYERGWRPGLPWRPEWAPTTKAAPQSED